ncbi:esterase-like activity of phytase family protein [Neobacillus cucumis]|uniref:esterase-like activity of phytase family protein n=1 Tax=Neobacillus cucumis TaxID=1740721 RepID=UPI00196573EA|nr:esterase-like activity of phytase family protein [Neobacillus cucumis]MBM7652188.1 hypothetical protein [Neobacillus cucumis]
MRFTKLLAAGTTASLLLISQLGTASAETVSHSKESLNAKDHQKTKVEHHTVGNLSFIGEQRIANDAIFNGTPVGGLSGIDYDPQTNKWIMISDDRSDLAPARFYTGQLNYDSKKFNSVNLSDVTIFKQPDGSTYPNRNQYAVDHNGVVPDLESIRVDPKSHNIWYTSEGDLGLGLVPFIRQANQNGQYLSSFQIPIQFTIGSNHGFRNNLALEGSSFSPNGEFYFTSMEAPLFQDGNISTVDAGGYSRITKYDRQGHILAQYAYTVSAIPSKPGAGKSADNGVSEMLAINNHEFLMLERSGVQAADGSYSNYIRIYKVDTRHASNISNMDSLLSGDYKSVSKELVLDLNTLNLPKLDNVEGMTWGPKLANGHDSLVLVSDNNFNSTQVTQFLAFDVDPK